MPNEAATVQKEDKEVKEVVQFTTQAEIVKAMEADPALSAEFIKAEQSGKMDDFVKKYQKSEAPVEVVEPVKPDTEPKKAEKAAPPAEEPDEEVEIPSHKVRKKDLGTYIKNRKPEEAIAEALKGNRQKDKTIQFLKEERLPALEGELDETVKENKTLKQQLAEYEAKKAAAAAEPVKKAEPVAEEELPDDLEDGDMLDSDYQKKVIAHVKATAKANKALLAKQTAQEQEIASLKSGIEEAKTGTKTLAETVQRGDAAGAEDDQIDRMRKRNTDIFVSARSIAKIEGEYKEFLEDLRVKAGVKEPVFNDKGGFTAGIVSAFHQYHAQDEAGKLLRAQCEAADIRPPEDLEDVTKIRKIQAIRKQYGVKKKRTGEYEDLPYEEALQKFVGTDLGTVRKQSRVEGQDAYEKALAKRADKAHEIKATDGADPADLAGISLKDFDDRLEKYLVAKKAGKDNPEERAVLESICKIKGAGTEETKSILGG